MGVDDGKVQEYIDGALITHWGKPILKLLSEAFDTLHAMREAGRCTDEDLAAAEHYMYSREAVAKGGLTEFYKQTSSTVMYDGLKRGLDTIGQRDLLKTGACPVSAPSKDQIRWGLKGADDGLKDYQTIADSQGKVTGKKAGTSSIAR